MYHHEKQTPPAFNIPSAVLWFAALCFAVHLVRTYVLSQAADFWVLNVFAFVPVFYTVSGEQLIAPLARLWSPFSYSFLHGDFTHLLMNMVWMLAFGSALARRFSTVRFVLFISLASLAGAGAHYIFHSFSNMPVIGASGVVSACMGAAIRFAFTPGYTGDKVHNAPRLSLLDSFKNRTIVFFIIAWFTLNWLFGAGILPLGIESAIAWEAHMGGFLFGWLGFSLFDKRFSPNI